MVVSGEADLGVYQAAITNPQTGATSHSPAKRHFCRHCGSALWLWDPRWPELVHPFASAMDTDLPVAPEHTHLMLASKAKWVEPCIRRGDKQFDAYPDESLAQWRQRLGKGD